MRFFYNITNGNETIGRMIPPVNNLTLTGTTLSGTYQAQNLISVETNVTVSGIAVLKAGNTINLKPGFTASSGCNLTISVGAVTSDKYYYLKDHLGSIRVVVDTIGEIVSYSDYDVWGMILNGRSSNYGFADDKYKFTGKELDTETGYFYFGARAYDGRIGRWNVVDPLFEKYPNVSPYNYALNNPLRFIDPKGMEAVDATPDDPDDKKKKQQQESFRYLEKVGKYVEKGVEIISEGVATSVNQGSQVLKQGSEVVAQSILTNGPGILNNLSDGVAVLGISVGTGFLSAGQVEIGGPILGGSLTLSTRLDIAALGLTLIDYGFNGGGDRLNKLSNQADRLLLGGAFGKVLGKVASSVKIFTPIYNPIIF